MENQVVQRLFEKKLLPEIKGELKARDEATEELRKLADKVEKFTGEAAEDRQAVEVIQGLLNEEILNGLNTAKSLKELEVKRGSMEAHERLVSKLSGEHEAAGNALRLAQADLDQAFREAVKGLRPDVEATVRGVLVEALSVLVSFERETANLSREKAIEPGNAFFTDFNRFLKLDSVLKDLGSFLSPVGGGSSLAQRRKLIAEWPEKYK